MKRHPFDPVSAVSGLLFLGLGIAFLYDDVDATDLFGRLGVAVLLLSVGLFIGGAMLRADQEQHSLSPKSEPDENQLPRPPLQ